MSAPEFTTQDRVILLLSVIPYLREHGPTPLTELAAAFDVDARHLRRLIQFLGMAGVPGDTSTYQDEDLFDIDWEALEEHDLVSLTRTVAVEDTPRFSATEAAAIRAGLHALLPMLPERESSVAHSLMQKLRLASAAKTTPDVVSVDAEAAHPAVSVIAAALAAQTQLSFEYHDARDAVSSRRVDPLMLQQQGLAWYMRAWCHDRAAERTFALDRMRSVAPVNEPVTHTSVASGFEILAPESAFPAGLRAVLRVTERAYAALIGFAPVRVTEVDATGWCLAEITLSHPGAAVRVVQTLPGEIVVCEPPAARAAVAQWAQLAQAEYGE